MKIPQRQPEYKDKMDTECLALCDAMNKMPGIQTVESCCGHGEEEFRIWFMAENLESLPALLYWFDGCHSGIYGWSVQVKTDCAMSPAFFSARSRSKGEMAYKEANVIADCIEEYLETK